MNKQLIYSLLLLLVCTITAVVVSILDAPKEYYLGINALFAGIYGWYSVKFQREKRSNKYKKKD